METATAPIVTAAPQTQPIDGKAHLLAKLPRGQDEILKVTPIHGGLYRCTWYLPMEFGNPKRNGQITQSKMIRCENGEITTLPRQ